MNIGGVSKLSKDRLLDELKKISQLNTLEKLGSLNNTIIVLWGDHGWHLGDHDMWGKHTNYEQATKAPLIIAAPGLKPGQSKSMTEFVDIFPTL